MFLPSEHSSCSVLCGHHPSRFRFRGFLFGVDDPIDGAAGQRIMRKVDLASFALSEGADCVWRIVQFHTAPSTILVSDPAPDTASTVVPIQVRK